MAFFMLPVSITGGGFDRGESNCKSRLDRAAARVDVAAVGAGSGTIFEMRVAILALDCLAAVRGADLVVGHLVVVVDASAVGHLPVPAVRTALGHEVDLLASATSQRDLARDEPGTLAQILRITARERASGITIVTTPAAQCVREEAEHGQLAHVGIPLSCHSLSAPFCFGMYYFRAIIAQLSN